MGYVGTYDRTIFYNPSNKYCIISVKTSDQSVPQQARSAYHHRDNMIRFIAVGYELPQTDKVSMILDGEWENGKHGVQLQVDKCEEIVPQTKEGVYGYLSSRLIKGVGEKTAALIVNRFGADALRVLENEPERLLEIRGITPDKLEDIKASYAESRCVRDLMILLTPFNVTPVTAMKIYEHFGSRSVDILQKNPYELCQVSGFGFKRVDAIVRKGDLPLNSPMRIHGAVFAALDTGRNEKGHLFLEEDALAKTGVKLLNENITDGQVKVTPEEVDAVVQDMILKGEIVSSNGNIYQSNVFVQEDETARKIAEMLAVPPVTLDISESLEYVRKNLGLALSQRQSEAVYMAFRSNLSIITGSPGTGKTTVLRAIIEVFQMLYPKGKILLAAPTGRASRRMAESTGRNDAKTLHSLLGLLGDSGPIQKDKQKEPLDADLIIVDESSMIDMWLARQFFSRVRMGTRVILVGDVDQLQSVGAGDIFYDYAKGKAPKNAYCTACKHNVSVAEAKHNGEGVCPHCKRKITFKSRGRRGYIVDRSTAQVIQRLGSNEMIIRFVKAYRRYPKSDTSEFHVYENARLFLQWDGSKIIASESYYYGYSRDRITPWHPGDRPVFSRWYYNFEADCCGYLYHRNLDSELKGTPWQYSALKEYYAGDPTPLYAGQYLQKYLRYPMLEYLVKLKLYRLATYVAYGDIGGARYYDDSVLNSKGKTVTEVLGVGKKYIPLLQTIDPGPNQLTMIKAFLRDNIRPDLELMKWCSKNDIGEEAYITVPLQYIRNELQLIFVSATRFRCPSIML